MSLLVEVRQAFSELTPTMTRAIVMHEGIRRRKRTRSAQTQPTHIHQVKRITETDLVEAEKRYRAGETLRTLASDLGISRERLSRLLRERGVQFRLNSPTDGDIAEMIRSYQAGESLERIAEQLGFDAHTVRKHLLDGGFKTRDSHGRER
jgi:AraC-like DNA-binding protein